MYFARERQLSVEVRLMSEPCLWRWEIRDPERGEIIDSSWTREWTAYDSPDEALRAGRQRLTSLTRRDNYVASRASRWRRWCDVVGSRHHDRFLPPGQSGRRHLRAVRGYVPRHRPARRAEEHREN